MHHLQETGIQSARNGGGEKKDQSDTRVCLTQNICPGFKGGLKKFKFIHGSYLNLQKYDK